MRVFCGGVSIPAKKSKSRQYSHTPVHSPAGPIRSKCVMVISLFLYMLRPIAAVTRVLDISKAQKYT